MHHRGPQRSPGFTLVEMTMSVVILSTLALAFGFILMQDQKAYAALYEGCLGDLREDSRAAAIIFETLVRKSTVQRAHLDGTVLEVYYLGDPETSTRPDRYARFYVTAAQELVADAGPLDQDGTPLGRSDTIRLARHVSAVAFAVDGAGVKMTMTLTKGSRCLTTTGMTATGRRGRRPRSRASSTSRP